ncbi:hypothetical protein VIRA109638_14860 [Vibrio rarus]
MILYHGRVGNDSLALSCENAYSSSLLGDKAIYLADTRRAALQYSDPMMLENRQKDRKGTSYLFEVEVEFSRLAFLTEEVCSDLSSEDLSRLSKIVDEDCMAYISKNPHLMAVMEMVGTQLLPLLKACGFDGLKHDSTLDPILAATMSDDETSFAVFNDNAIKSIRRLALT